MRTLLRRLAAGAVVLGLLALGAFAWLWHDRPDFDELGLPSAPLAAGADAPTVTWLGVTTLLFDDGETRLLTDGYFSRPGLLDLALDRAIAPDEAAIARALATAGIDRLDAVIAAHSHFDHAMDVAVVAELTGALVLGSPSTANVARGGGVPEGRIDVVVDGARRTFGAFSVEFRRSPHAPLVDGAPPYPGSIDAPLIPPAPVSAWREGGSWSILVAHPGGTALVHASAGFEAGSLAGLRADSVFLGIGGLAGLGREHAEAYWIEVVGESGAGRVVLVHHDDFTAPFGEPRAFPRLVDDVEKSAGWLAEIAGPAVALELPVFGRATGLR